MKQILTIGFLIFFVNCYGQKFPSFEIALKKEFPENSRKDGRWVFYSTHGNIQKIKKPLVSSRIRNYTFFKVNLTNYLGWHVEKGTCLVLFDSMRSNIILVEPQWYNRPSDKFLNLFFRQKFQTQDSLIAFISELNELMEVGSSFKFVKTNITDTLITYDLVDFQRNSYTKNGSGITSTIHYNQDEIWRKITYTIDKLSLARYSSINPKTGKED